MKLEQLIANIDDEIRSSQQLQQEDAFDLEGDQERVDIGRHICIELGAKHLAIPLDAVLEAGEHIPVQPLPLLPDWITGIANIRGEIVSVVNLNLFFNTKSTQPHLQNDDKPYLIVHNDNLKIAVTVDRILATRPLYILIAKKSKKNQKKDMLSQHLSGQAFYEERIDHKELFIFDLDKFLSSNALFEFTTI